MLEQTKPCKNNEKSLDNLKKIAKCNHNKSKKPYMIKQTEENSSI